MHPEGLRKTARPARTRRLAPYLIACGLVAACGAGGPHYTLQQVMFQIDYFDKDLIIALERHDGTEAATQRAGELATWFEDPAFGEYLASARFQGDPALFRKRKDALLEQLAELRARLAQGDREGAVQTHVRLRAACDACHADFRPDLLKQALR